MKQYQVFFRQSKLLFADKKKLKIPNKRSQSKEREKKRLQWLKLTEEKNKEIRDKDAKARKDLRLSETQQKRQNRLNITREKTKTRIKHIRENIIKERVKAMEKSVLFSDIVQLKDKIFKEKMKAQPLLDCFEFVWE